MGKAKLAHGTRTRGARGASTMGLLRTPMPPMHASATDWDPVLPPVIRFALYMAQSRRPGQTQPRARDLRAASNDGAGPSKNHQCRPERRAATI